MATAVAKTPAETVPLTDAEIAHNQKVSDLQRDMLRDASDISQDMKVRQLPTGLKGEKVYGPHSANRSQVNALSSLVKKVAETIVCKLAKGGGKKSKGGFVGFSVPSNIAPDMAIALGLREGNAPLWPQGGKPIFSAALITRFFSHYVMKNGLIHSDNLSKFSADELMTRLYSPYTVSSVKPGKEPIDLNNLTYPAIQQLNKNFVEKRNKAQGTGPNLNPETEDGAKLIAVFKQLEEQFKTLGKIKETVTKAMEAEAKAKADVVSAKACLDAGHISQSLFNSYAASYKQVSDEKNRLYADYKEKAKAMGI